MDDVVKKKIIYTRPSATSYTALPVEFPIGIDEVVELIAIHWHIEAVAAVGGQALLIAALSENPNHELNPPIGVAEFQGNQSLYGMATFIWGLNIAGSDGIGASIYGFQVVPLYGLLRPKRQVAVFAHLWGASVVGIRGEVYYKAAQPPSEVVDAINRRSGKYRRT